jgi:hypothetical protein
VALCAARTTPRVSNASGNRALSLRGPGDHLRVEREAFSNQFPEKRFVVTFFLLERRAAFCLAQSGHGDQVGVKLRGRGGYFERGEVSRFGGDVFVKEFLHADVIGTKREKLEVDTAQLLTARTYQRMLVATANSFALPMLRFPGGRAAHACSASLTVAMSAMSRGVTRADSNTARRAIETPDLYKELR